MNSIPIWCPEKETGPGWGILIGVDGIMVWKIMRVGVYPSYSPSHESSSWIIIIYTCKATESTLQVCLNHYTNLLREFPGKSREKINLLTGLVELVVSNH